MAVFGVGSDYKGIITIFADGVPVDADDEYADFDIVLDFYTTSERKKRLHTDLPVSFRTVGMLHRMV